MSEEDFPIPAPDSANHDIEFTGVRLVPISPEDIAPKFAFQAKERTLQVTPSVEPNINQGYLKCQEIGSTEPLPLIGLVAPPNVDLDERTGSFFIREDQPLPLQFFVEMTTPEGKKVTRPLNNEDRLGDIANTEAQIRIVAVAANDAEPFTGLTEEETEQLANAQTIENDHVIRIYDVSFTPGDTRIDDTAGWHMDVLYTQPMVIDLTPTIEDGKIYRVTRVTYGPPPTQIIGPYDFSPMAIQEERIKWGLMDEDEPLLTEDWPGAPKKPTIIERPHETWVLSQKEDGTWTFETTEERQHALKAVALEIVKEAEALELTPYDTSRLIYDTTPRPLPCDSEPTRLAWIANEYQSHDFTANEAEGHLPPWMWIVPSTLTADELRSSQGDIGRLSELVANMPNGRFVRCGDESITLFVNNEEITYPIIDNDDFPVFVWTPRIDSYMEKRQLPPWVRGRVRK